jgi:hypothetical protein
MSFDLSNHFEEDMSHIEKFNPTKSITVLYYNELKKASFVKRFIPEFSDKKVCMFPEEDGNKFEKAVSDKRPQIRVEYDNEGAKKPVEPEEIILDEFVEVMGVKAKGKKLSNHPVKAISWLDPIPVEDEEEIETEDETEDETDDENLDENEIETEDENEVESEVGSGESDNNDADEAAEVFDVVDAVEVEEIKAPKKPKESKTPKEPKETKTPKEPKEPKAVKEIKEPKAPLPPVNPPDFPEDDESGKGIQMSLF